MENLIVEHLSVGGLVVLTSHQEVSIPNVQVLEL
jgi:heme exporter protein A